MDKETLNKLRIKTTLLGLRITHFTMDKVYPKDPDPRNWRTVKGEHVHLSNGKIDGGLGGKWNGRSWSGKKQTNLAGSKENMPPKQGNVQENEKKDPCDVRKEIGYLQQEFERLYEEAELMGSLYLNKKIKNNYTREECVEATERAFNVQAKLMQAKINAAKNGVMISLDKATYGEHAQKIEKIFTQMPKGYRVLWNMYGDNVQENFKYKDRAHCAADGTAVFLSIEDDSKGSDFEKPYEVYYHENAHAMDILFAQDAHLTYSAKYHNGEFIKAIHEDVEAMMKKVEDEIKPEYEKHLADGDIDWMHVNRYFSYRKKKLDPKKDKYNKKITYQELEKRLRKIPLSDRGTLSDIVSGATKNKCDAGVSHETEYWNDSTYEGVEVGLATEAFAGFIQGYAATPERMKILKKYLPNASRVFNNMIEEAAKIEEMRWR